jgi:hypothetical protein
MCTAPSAPRHRSALVRQFEALPHGADLHGDLCHRKKSGASHAPFRALFHFFPSLLPAPLLPYFQPWNGPSVARPHLGAPRGSPIGSWSFPVPSATSSWRGRFGPGTSLTVPGIPVAAIEILQVCGENQIFRLANGSPPENAQEQPGSPESLRQRLSLALVLPSLWPQLLHLHF